MEDNNNVCTPTGTDDEYYNMYKTIYERLVGLYQDKAILECMQLYNQAISNGHVLPSAVHDLVLHICELAKRDLVLEIWKLLYDGDSRNKNTLRRLKNYIFRKYQRGCIKKSKEVNGFQKPFTDIRNRYLAHEGDTKGLSVSMEDAEFLLNSARDMFNALCFTEIDNRVEIINNQRLEGMKIDEILQFYSVLTRGMQDYGL